jgi:hypothetical protein
MIFFPLLISTISFALGSRLYAKSPFASKYPTGSVQLFNRLGEKSDQNYVKYFQRNFNPDSNEPKPDYHLDFDNPDEARFTERRLGSQVRMTLETSLEDGNYFKGINVSFNNHWKKTQTSILAVPIVNLTLCQYKL